MSRIDRIIVFFFTVLFFFPGLGRAEDHHPFQPGEKMHFVLKYGLIPAGSATLEVQDMKVIQGIEAYHFVLTARSNSFIDLFFKVRDRIDSYADTEMNHSLYYKKDQKEGKTRRNIKVDFDWQNNKSTYVNFDSEPKVINLLPGTFDPLSVFYFTRLLDFSEKDQFEHPVTDGEKNLMGVLRVIGTETIKVPAGIYDTVVLEPDLNKIEGVFSKKQRAKIKLWVTNDDRRLLVQMESEAVVGSFIGELVGVEGHDLEQGRISSLEKTR